MQTFTVFSNSHLSINTLRLSKQRALPIIKYQERTQEEKHPLPLFLQRSVTAVVSRLGKVSSGPKCRDPPKQYS